jgi:hypothetical protein
MNELFMKYIQYIVTGTYMISIMVNYILGAVVVMIV